MVIFFQKIFSSLRKNGFRLVLWVIPLLYFCIGFNRSNKVEFYTSWVYLTLFSVIITRLTKIHTFSDAFDWIKSHKKAAKFLLISVFVIFINLTLSFDKKIFESVVDLIIIQLQGIYFFGACAAIGVWFSDRFSKGH